MDALSHILRDCEVEGSVVCRFEGAGRWAVSYPAGQHAAFHVVTRGRCVLEVGNPAGAASAPDAPPPAHITVDAGAFVVLPHGHAHLLRSWDAEGSGGLRPTPVAIADLAPLERGGLAPNCAVPLGAARDAQEPDAGYLCGSFRLGATGGAGRGAHPVLGVLPAVLHVPAGAAGAPDGLLGPWLDTFVAAAACEAAGGRPGGDLVLARLSEVLFVHAVRAHLAEAAALGTPAPAGWLRALGDPPVARALALLHEDPARPWTVDALARAVGMSRSRFAARFAERVGRPPLDYLAEWRMHRARKLLRAGRASVGEVAARLGYRSEAAFSHAFRRRSGVAPGAYRRARPSDAVA